MFRSSEFNREGHGGTQTATWTVFVVWNLHEHMIGMSSWSACALPCVFLSYNIELRHENPWNIDLKWKEMNHYIIIHNFTRSLEIDLRLTADMTWGSFSQDIINLNRLSLLWNRFEQLKYTLSCIPQGFVIWSLQSIHNFETKYFTIWEENMFH